jgi:GNAT superfamily N-acetyltransferase
MNERDAVVVRTWQPTDNQALINIARTMSLPARVRLGIDRAPDFAAFCQAAGDNFDIVVAETDGRVAGFMETRRLAFLLRGSPVPIVYIALAGVAPGSRGLGIFPRLIAEAEHRSRAAGINLGLGFVNARNPRVARFFATNRDEMVIGRRIVVSTILLGPRHRVPRSVVCDCATPADLPAILQLVRRSYARHALAPVVEEAGLVALGTENLTVTRDGGRIVATLGTWNQRAFRRIMVVGYGPAERRLRQLLNPVRGLTRIARLPAPGEELQVLYATFAAAEPGSEGAFAGLLRSVCNRRAGQGYHALLLGLPEDDPLSATTRGLWQFRNVDLPVLISRDATVRALLGTDRTSVHFEYALA